MRNETVKPTPPIVPLPITAAQPTVGRSRPRLSLVSSQAEPTIATGLPSTYPAITPRVTGDRTAWARKLPLSAMPALASPNSGTMT